MLLWHLLLLVSDSHGIFLCPSSPWSMSVDSIAPSQSPLSLDSTNVLSEDFSRLFMDDTNVSHGDIDLPRVSPERDTLTDDDHKALDATILATFSSDKRLNEEPKLPALLSNISNEDMRMKNLTTDEAEELLAREPSIRMVLRNAWRKEAFKEVRQLGAHCIQHTSCHSLKPSQKSCGPLCEHLDS